MSDVVAVQGAVLRLLADGPLASAELRRRVRYTLRPGLTAALDGLLASGDVGTEPARAGGTRYTLTPEVPVTPEVAVDPKTCTRCHVNRRRRTSPYCGRCLMDLARHVQHTDIGEKENHVV